MLVIKKYIASTLPKPVYNFLQKMRGRTINPPEPLHTKDSVTQSDVFVHKPHISKEMQLRMDVAEAVLSMEALRQAAQAINYTYFTDYDAQIETKRREFRSAIKYFDLKLEGARVLDIGPGTADSLDMAREMGASKTLFIEEEPFFVKFAEFKGHSGVMKNYTFAPHFDGLERSSIDLIYTKGSINCEWVNMQERLRQEGHIDHYFKFDEWLDEMITLLDPDKGRVILMPAMDKQNTRVIDHEYDLDTYYWCPDKEAYRNSYFSQTLIAKGFQVFEEIPGFTQPKAFPLAFYYDGKGKKVC
jgi:hypothetical protein